MTTPDMNLLTALDVLLSEQSVTGAARRLNLSHSAMSRTLSRLRDVTGDALLVRAGRNMVLTPYAESIRVQTKQTVFDALAILQPDLHSLNLTHLERTFTLRANDGFIDAFAAPLIAYVGQHAPHVRLCFLPKPEKSSAALREGQVDLEIGVVANMGPEIRTKALFRDRFVAVVSKQHSLAKLSALSLEQYVSASHIVASRRGEFGGPVDIALKALGLQRHIAATVPSFPAALAIAHGSDLMALVPRSFLIHESLGEANARFVAFELPVETPALTVSQMWHPRQQGDAAHRWLREALETVCQQLMRFEG